MWLVILFELADSIGYLGCDEMDATSAACVALQTLIKKLPVLIETARIDDNYWPVMALRIIPNLLINS